MNCGEWLSSPLILLVFLYFGCVIGLLSQFGVEAGIQESYQLFKRCEGFLKFGLLCLDEVDRVLFGWESA